MSPQLELPAGDVTVNVKLICSTNFGPAQLKRFMAPPIPGIETHSSPSPSLSFFIQHPNGEKLVFDLGIRKDYENYSPSIASYLPTTKYTIDVKKDVADILQEGGIALDDINAVIWSHWHWDHIGDPSRFPSSTDLIVGPGFKAAMLPGSPAAPDSPIQESDYRDRKLREIVFDGPRVVSIGSFAAFDYFGDGSFYLLDSPGHAVGHLCGLARTTSDTFVLMGGDVAHYSGIIRPSKHLQLPESISPHPCHPESTVPMCPGHAFEDLQKSRGRKVTDTLYDLTYGGDIPLAKETVGRLQELDCNDNIMVVIAHDGSARDYLPHFPQDLNSWKEQGLGKKLRWSFLRDLKSYWVSKGIA